MYKGVIAGKLLEVATQQHYFVAPLWADEVAYILFFPEKNIDKKRANQLKMTREF